MPVLVHLAFAIASTTAPLAAAEAPAPNALTPAERAAGWTLLFDGSSTAAWRSFRGEGFPEKGWTVRDGALVVTAGGGDLVTRDSFGEFELVVEYRCTPKANSGIMFHVSEKHGAPWMTGPEFQVIDDAGHGLSPDSPQSAGALYDLAAPPADKVVRPAGEWNEARIMVRDGRLRQWLNGGKTVDLRLDGADWRQRIAGSKFAAYDGFGVLGSGMIALQDHGDEVAFRNIRIRRFDAARAGEKALFNGTDLTGWSAHLEEGAARDEVWSVRDGVLRCAGKPAGYLHTDGTYTSYVLTLEWRWPPGSEPGNSGVLLRQVGPHMVWPKSVEAQLHSGHAGDFWCIGDFPMQTAPERTRGRNTRKTHGNENPPGEWNEYEIVVDGPLVILRVNGEELNRATGVEVVPGRIALQSEGAPIEFRRIRLVEIP